MDKIKEHRRKPSVQYNRDLVATLIFWTFFICLQLLHLGSIGTYKVNKMIDFVGDTPKLGVPTSQEIILVQLYCSTSYQTCPYTVLKNIN